MAANWSEIPEELVYMVVEQLVCIDDLIRFRAVCKTWRSVSVPKKEKKKSYSPLLMLAKSDNDNLHTDNINDDKCMRSFVIPYDRDEDEGPNYKMRNFNIELPKAQGRRCWGSPYGWVVTIGLDFNISLLNPLTGAQLSLPPQPVLQDQSLFRKELSKNNLEPARIISVFTSKFALGWHQSSHRWLVMAIFGAGREAAFTFTGMENSSWTCIQSTRNSEDVILFQDRIFIIDCHGNLSVCDIDDTTPPKAIQIAPPPIEHDGTDTYRFYLVEMGGNLHLVARYFDSHGAEDHLPLSEFHYVTIDFVVWRFNFSKRKWYDLNELGEYALFVGNNTSFAISTTVYSDISRNCFYFTDDHYTTYNTRFCDMGVYDYEEGTIQPFHIANMGAFSKFSRPIFFMPSL